MKFSRMMLTAALITVISSTSAFATPLPKATGSPQPSTTQQKNECEKSRCIVEKKNDGEEKLRDPINMLQRKKQKVKELFDSGKITREEADRLNEKIDAKIKEIQEFNRLPVDQKKERLISKFKDKVSNKVKEGKLTQKEADELIEKFTRRIKEWDGKGYPGYRSEKQREKGKGLFRKKQ